MLSRMLATLCLGTLSIGPIGLMGGCVHHHRSREVIVERDCSPEPVIVERRVVVHDHRPYWEPYRERYHHDRRGHRYYRR